MTARGLRTALAVCVVLAMAAPALADSTLRSAPGSAPDVKVADDGIPGTPTRASGGPDGFGYVFIDSNEPGGPTFQWVEINATGTQVLLGDDQITGALPIGFSFPFYGVLETSFHVSSNGFISFSDSAGSDLANDCPLPSSSGNPGMIAVHWDDLDPGDTSDPIWYQTFAAGSCPWGGYGGACLVVEFEGFCHFPGGAACTSAGTFEAILFDSGDIVLQFLDPGAELGSGATTGIENHAQDIGLTYGCDGTYLAANLAVLFTQPPFGDLEIGLAAPLGFGFPGAFPLDVTVTNNGPDDQTGVAVAMALPAQLAVVSSSCGGSGSWSWNIGGLAAGASRDCEVMVRFNTPACQTVSVTATVSGDLFDPAGNNVAALTNAGGNVVDDPSFEAGTPNPFWAEASTNFGTPLCDVPSCGTGTGTGPRTGAWWTWFGGIASFEEGSVSQSVVIEPGANLTFWVEAILCASPSDFVEVTIDGTQVWQLTGASPLCGALGYSQQTVSLAGFDDGGVHTLEFHSVSTGAGTSNFFIDDVEILAAGGCTDIPDQPPQEPGIPELGRGGTVLLVLLLAAAAVVVLRRLR